MSNKAMVKDLSSGGAEVKYISLGYFCSIAMDLEKLGLGAESSPFDWVISNFEGVISAISNNFRDFLKYEELAQSRENKSIYKNVKYDIEFFHDFDKYESLEMQLPGIQEKYARRIARFYKSISEPTLFIRYISDRNGGAELKYIEKNYEMIMRVLKSFNSANDILFIGNEGVTSSKIVVYNVMKDKNDFVSRSPLFQNRQLFKKFNDVDFPNKKENRMRYMRKEKYNRRIDVRLRRKAASIIKALFCKVYVHNKWY